MIDKTQYIIAFIRDNKMIFQNDKSIVSYILTHTHTHTHRNLRIIIKYHSLIINFLRQKAIIFINLYHLKESSSFAKRIYLPNRHPLYARGIRQI